VLRYQNNQAYAVHPDYLSDGPENYDYNTAGVGGNRFATILLYMSDVDSGGETVFDKVYAHNATPEQLGTSDSEVTRKLRESGEIDSLKAGSWEETLTAVRLTVALMTSSRIEGPHTRRACSSEMQNSPCSQTQTGARRALLFTAPQRCPRRVRHAWRLSYSQWNKVGCQLVGLECSTSRVRVRATETS